MLMITVHFKYKFNFTFLKSGDTLNLKLVTLNIRLKASYISGQRELSMPKITAVCEASSKPISIFEFKF